MSKKLISELLYRNSSFLIMIFILNFINLIQYSQCLGENHVNNIANEIKKNDLGKIMFETFKIEYELSQNRNKFEFDNNFKTFKDTLEYKLNEHSNISKFYFDDHQKCDYDILLLKNKVGQLKYNLSQANNEKYYHDLKIKYHRMTLEITKFIKNHYKNKSDLFNKIQKNFFFDKYLLLPILENLIDFTKYLKAHILLLKRNYGSNKNELTRIIMDFFLNENFKKLNKILNLLEPENIYLLENSLEHNMKDKSISEDFLKLKENEFSIFASSNKCILVNLESYSNIYLNFNDYIKINLNDNIQINKKLAYCSEYLSLLRYFSLNFNEDFNKTKWNLKSLDKINNILKYIKLKFFQKIDSINKQFEEISLKFSGTNSYLDNQVKFFQNKEDEITKNISFIEEESIFNIDNDYSIENNLIEDIIAFKNEIAKNESFNLYESDSNLLINIKKLNNLISFDPSIINELFQIKKESNEKITKIYREEMSSFIEFENVLLNDKIKNNVNSLDVEDIDFDAV